MIIDIIIIALIALGVFFGYKKGLVGILIGVASLILSIILAFVLQGPVSEYLYSTPVGTSIESKVTEFVNDTLSSENNENVDSEDNTKKEEKISPKEKIGNNDEKTNNNKNTVDLLDFEDEPKSKEEKEELNILPQIEEDDDYDLQKELEAKFDELFGDDS